MRTLNQFARYGIHQCSVEERNLLIINDKNGICTTQQQTLWGNNTAFYDGNFFSVQMKSWASACVCARPAQARPSRFEVAARRSEKAVKRSVEARRATAAPRRHLTTLLCWFR